MSLGPDAQSDNVASSEPKGTIEIVLLGMRLLLQRREQRALIGGRAGTVDLVQHHCPVLLGSSWRQQLLGPLALSKSRKILGFSVF